MNKYIALFFAVAGILIFSCKKPDTKPSTGTHPVASFTKTLDGYKVAFTNTSTGNPTSFSWNFGDASAADTSRNPIHTYSAFGTYHVVLTATNKAGSDTFGMNVIVSNATRLVASFTNSINGYKAAFTNTSTGNPTSFSWNFGDASITDTAKNPVHTYSTSGTYHVVLTATNKAGSDTFGLNITIYEQVVDIHTKFGDMYLWLYNEMPVYKANYLKNVTTHLYDSTTFHRCVPNFVIQGGDSLSKGDDQSLAGTGGGDDLPFSVVKGITHIYGAVGAASLGTKQPGNDWQFYIVTNTAGDHNLDGNYAVFGYIMKGMNVAITIQNQPQNSANNMPLTPIRMSCTILYETKAQILTNYGYTVK